MAWLKRSSTEGTKNNEKADDTSTMAVNEDEDTAICVNCGHHRENEAGYEHACFANVEEEIDYVTGEKVLNGIEDCEDVNNDGCCSDFERKK